MVSIPCHEANKLIHKSLESTIKLTKLKNKKTVLSAKRIKPKKLQAFITHAESVGIQYRDTNYSDCIKKCLDERAKLSASDLKKNGPYRLKVRKLG